MKQPNLIFVFPDQLGASHLGCYGNETVSTPNIDRFAEGSLLLERAYTCSPVCTPYRGVLFTGRYPSTSGVVENGMRLPELPTLADALGAAGYYTAYLGKWHLSGDPQANRWVPPEHRGGFQDFTGWESHHVDHWRGRIWADTASDDSGSGRSPGGGAERPMPREIPMPGHETDALTEMAAAKLRELSSAEKPFCLFVAYQAPHPPCSPPPEFAVQYRGALSAPPNLPEQPPAYHKPGWNARYSNDEFRRRYLGEVSHLDAAMGRLFAVMDEIGLFETSIVVFTSDHGELAGAHGRYGKFVMYEESVRVPLIVSMPRGGSRQADPAFRNGLRVGDLFSTVDFLPTFAELCGASPSGGVLAADLPGKSFAARWRALAAGNAETGSAGLRDFVFIEYHDQAVTDGRYKLVAGGANSKPGEHSLGRDTRLFDLQNDPYELHDRAGDLAFAEVEARLASVLGEWRSTLG